MRTILVLFAAIFLSVTFTNKAIAITVFCPNCSDNITQAIEKATGIEQLGALLNQLNEAVIQTEQQIQMVINQIKQYENMIKNTLQLPMEIYNKVRGLMKTYAELTDRLRTIKGDVMALGQIFDEKYPGLDIIKQMADGNSDISAEELWDQWSRQSDEAIQAAFQVTGESLHDLVQNAQALEAQIDDLLSTPEGQMQAIQAGNALAAIQIGEAQKLRGIMSTTLQSTAIQNAQEQKEKELAAERWRNFGGTNDLYDTLGTTTPDSF
jgi:P-type conjugative transfer protein TrbJ